MYGHLVVEGSPALLYLPYTSSTLVINLLLHAETAAKKRDKNIKPMDGVVV